MNFGLQPLKTYLSQIKKETFIAIFKEKIKKSPASLASKRYRSRFLPPRIDFPLHMVVTFTYIYRITKTDVKYRIKIL